MPALICNLQNREALLCNPPFVLAGNKGLVNIGIQAAMPAIVQYTSMWYPRFCQKQASFGPSFFWLIASVSSSHARWVMNLH